ncbi:LytR/AlgR family response regulator transcription factor [Paraflavitalea pollutisoli]|uniref:LytR/AlgR family response regulator transcription factor n=1 Tax=Paraflavitalea pollutisoli TaxID=3034143 RepID=UPI0023EB8D4E|nr:LytTR family DNA-binding domain-containing protein [Paraflavitalea sp. H1-2-19X]
MTIRTILVEDEPHNAEHLHRLIAAHTPQLLVAAVASTVPEALVAIRLHQPDLLLLDVQLKQETGFDLLSQLAGLAPEVIFVTAFDQYGVRAIKFAALDYLLKPVTASDLQEAVGKAVVRLQQKQKDRKLDHLLSFLATNSQEQQKLALPLQDQVRYETIVSIVRLESSNNYSYVLLESGEKLLVCRTLKEFAGMLEPYGFIRTHQSHLVNSRFVKSFLKEDGGTLLLTDQSKIPLSKAHRAIVKEKLQQLPGSLG